MQSRPGRSINSPHCWQRICKTLPTFQQVHERFNFHYLFQITIMHTACNRKHGVYAPTINVAARSAIMIVGALVLPLTMRGMIEASATRRPRIP